VSTRGIVLQSAVVCDGCDSSWDVPKLYSLMPMLTIVEPRSFPIGPGDWADAIGPMRLGRCDSSRSGSRDRICIMRVPA
jgi:hypothetical protein